MLLPPHGYNVMDVLASSKWESFVAAHAPSVTELSAWYSSGGMVRSVILDSVDSIFCVSGSRIFASCGITYL